jgi:hypothetical protein
MLVSTKEFAANVYYFSELLMCLTRLPHLQGLTHEFLVVCVTALPITQLFAWGDGTLEEPGTVTLGEPVSPGSSRFGIEPKTPWWLVQDFGLRSKCFLITWASGRP